MIRELAIRAGGTRVPRAGSRRRPYRLRSRSRSSVRTVPPHPRPTSHRRRRRLPDAAATRSRLRTVDLTGLIARRADRARSSDSVHGVLCRFGSHVHGTTRDGFSRESPPCSAPRWAPGAGSPGRAGPEPACHYSSPTFSSSKGTCRHHIPGYRVPLSLGPLRRTSRGLIEAAGFATVRTEELHVHFGFRDVDDYLTFTADTAGPVALVLSGLSAEQREALTGPLEEAFRPFVAAGGYALPAVALRPLRARLCLLDTAGNDGAHRGVENLPGGT